MNRADGRAFLYAMLFSLVAFNTVVVLKINARLLAMEQHSAPRQATPVIDKEVQLAPRKRKSTWM